MIMVEFVKHGSDKRVLYNLANIDLYEDIGGAYIVNSEGETVWLSCSYKEAVRMIELAVVNHYRFLKDGIR